MNKEVNQEEIIEFVLSDSSRIAYTVKQVEMTNILGKSVAVLEEYSVSFETGEICKLFRTTEGNWYDMPDTNKAVNRRKIMFLKVAFENHFKTKMNK